MIPGLKLITEPNPGLFPKIDDRGGAVYNRIGSTTIMVNCVIAGNFCKQEGGGTCNADGQIPRPVAESRMKLHNCLLVGNWTDNGAAGGIDDGGGHFNRDQGKSELIHCTLIDNYAGNKYGGVANRDNLSELIVRNCIVYNNTDGDSQTGLPEEVHYETNLREFDVDHNVIEDVADEFKIHGDEVNASDVPGFESGVSSLSWSSPTYDADTGQTTFNGLSGLTVNAHVDKLFKPDTGEHPYLLIVANTATSITCLGKTADSSATGLIFDPHICECGLAHAAIDFGDPDYLVDAGDPCDLDNDPFTDILNRDLYLNVRDQGDAPDSGVHEVDAG